MTLRVPTNRRRRRHANCPRQDHARALATLKGKPGEAHHVVAPRKEYEAKINSGDLVSIAEVVRDLFRPTTRPSSPIPTADFRGRLHPPARSSARWRRSTRRLARYSRS
jgi:RNA polymerase-interacting CarD/CdnL/TRCF family regulator